MVKDPETFLTISKKTATSEAKSENQAAFYP
jgi:hypothetical protein